MVKKTLMLTVSLLALAACSPAGSLCPVGPFIPDAGASTRWTTGEKQQLVTLNNSGAKICGWMPPA